MKLKLASLVLFLILICACTAPSPAPSVPAKETQEPAVNEGAPIEPTPLVPIQKVVPAEIKDLVDKSTSRVKNAYYRYTGPQTGNSFYEFYVKDSKIKYIPSRAIKSLNKEDSFDSIFLDKVAKTARSYCTDPTCTFKGIKAELAYSDYYIPTIFDWLDFQTAEKIGEEQIENRATWIVKTEKGNLWLDNYYGVPLKVESDGNTYKYSQLAVNGVKDSDVSP